jgi:hypothetical protein
MPTSRLACLAFISALAATSLAYAADPVTLTKEETQQALSGKSITYGGRSGTTAMTYFSPDGKVTVRTMTSSRVSSGTWTVDDEGRFCVRIISGTAGDYCRHLMKTDTGYAMSTSRGGGMIPIEKME